MHQLCKIWHFNKVHQDNMALNHPYSIFLFDRVFFGKGEPLYYRNHFFGLGPIQKSKPKLADTFSLYLNRYRNHISKGEPSYHQYGVIFSITKEPLKPNLVPNFKNFMIYFEDFCLFSSFYKLIFPRKKWKTWEKFETKSFGFGKNNFGSNTDTKIRLWFRFPILKPGFGLFI